jgi:threonylcarbamoyladenosine tRNA methylthiotransferase MtaB
MKNKSTFTILTLGCKVNQFESEAIEKTLCHKGLMSWNIGIPCEKNTDKSLPEICIINTCTVTAKAAMQSRQAIRQAIRLNPNALIIVTGCYAQTKPEEIAAISGVNWIVSHDKKGSIPDLIESFCDSENKHPSIVFYGFDKKRDTKFNDMPATPIGTRTRPFLKIQDGCNAFCSYCIVPYARGRSRSLSEDLVMEKLHEFRNARRKEVVLTGIHLGVYGKDLHPAKSLFQLLLKIWEQGLIERLRLSSIEPCELSDDIIELAANWKGLCPHFHISLQSGDDIILRRMKRPYDSDFFRNLVLKIKNRLPDAAIGVDILSGFPGETQQAFENTVHLIESLPVSYLHVFPFSPREGTAAFRFSQQVSSKIVKSRCRILRELSDRLKYYFYNRFVGKTVEVLVEEKCERMSGLLKGISRNYIPVMFYGKNTHKNSLMHVKIQKVNSRNMVLGKI